MNVKICALALLSIFFILTLSTALQTSGTCDEIAHHIPVGYVLLTKWDFKMDTSQPPLARYIIALPLKLFMNLNMPDQIDVRRVSDRSIFGRDFLYKYNTDSKRIILFGRMPIMILGLLCGLFIFIWARSLYGNKCALLSLSLYCLSPDIIAHSNLATTDIAATFFIFLSAYSFWLFLNKSSVKNILFAALCLGLAQLSKYNAILLYPIFLLLIIFESGGQKRRYLFMKYALMAFASTIVIWAGYGFDLQPILKDAMRIEEKIEIARKIMPFLGDGTIEDMLFRMPMPLGAHILGLFGVLKHSYDGHGSFFLGSWSAGGNILYFPVAFLVKNTIPMLLLLLMGFFVTIKKTIGRAERIFLISIALYFIISSLGKLQIGIRHLLPLYPFCFMIAGRSADLLGRKVWNFVIALLLAWSLCITLMSWPNYIGYFNEAIGGSRNGYKYLRDSNIDWGQDLPALSRYIDKNRIDRVALEYFGQADPLVYGVRYYKLTPGELEVPKNSVYAISVEYLDNVLWTKKYKPTAVAGSSIFIYDLTGKAMK